MNGPEKTCPKCDLRFKCHAPRQKYCRPCSAKIPANRIYREMSERGEVRPGRLIRCKCGKPIWIGSKKCKSCNTTETNKRHWVKLKAAGKTWDMRRGPDHHNYKPSASDPDVGRTRARRIYGVKQCEKCGKDRAEIHHKDGNTFNNNPENLAFLCRRHHMLADRRGALEYVQVEQIRHIYKTGRYSQNHLARSFGVTQGAIANIIHS